MTTPHDDPKDREFTDQMRAGSDASDATASATASASQVTSSGMAGGDSLLTATGDTPSKLYAVDVPWKGEPLLSEALVIRATRQYYIVVARMLRAFRYRSRIPKEAADVTPEAAWRRFYLEQSHHEARLSNELTKVRRFIAVAAEALAGIADSSSPVR